MITTQWMEKQGISAAARHLYCHMHLKADVANRHPIDAPEWKPQLVELQRHGLLSLTETFGYATLHHELFGYDPEVDDCEVVIEWMYFTGTGASGDILAITREGALEAAKWATGHTLLTVTPKPVG